METEALICAAQEQAIRKSYIKFNMEKAVESPLCRMCGEKGESIGHVVSECEKLAQREYKRRHDNVARIVHWTLCGRYDLERGAIDIAIPGDNRVGAKEKEKIEKYDNLKWEVKKMWSMKK